METSYLQSISCFGLFGSKNSPRICIFIPNIPWNKNARPKFPTTNFVWFWFWSWYSIMVFFVNAFKLIILLLFLDYKHFCISRSAKSCWGDEKFKEVFCVDSSVDMNNLSLALIQGGVWPNQVKDFNSIEEDDKEVPSIIKGLYFRQFLPTSSAVSNFFYLWVCWIIVYK